METVKWGEKIMESNIVTKLTKTQRNGTQLLTHALQSIHWHMPSWSFTLPWSKAMSTFCNQNYFLSWMSTRCLVMKQGTENSHSAAERQVKKCSFCKVRGSIATPWSTWSSLELGISSCFIQKFTPSLLENYLYRFCLLCCWKHGLMESIA